MKDDPRHEQLCRVLIAREEQRDGPLSYPDAIAFVMREVPSFVPLRAKQIVDTIKGEPSRGMPDDRELLAQECITAGVPLVAAFLRKGSDTEKPLVKACLAAMSRLRLSMIGK